MTLTTSYPTLINNLCHRDYDVIDNFLSHDEFLSLQRYAENLYSLNQFEITRVGQGKSKTHAPLIRNDQSYWLDEAVPKTRAFFDALNIIRTMINRELYLGLVSIEAHFARYAPGGFYQKHVDQFKQSDHRRISCVYYLNSTWETSYGGELILYSRDDRTLATLEPTGNRLVCFNSELPHEVRPATQARWSIASWMSVRSLSLTGPKP